MEPAEQSHQIYTVPESLRKANQEAYTPQLISIGPIHRDRDELKPMKKSKETYRRVFWKRPSLRPRSRSKFLHYVKFSQERILKCYSEEYQIETDEFVEMIELDAVFIMELFLRESDGSKYKNDPMIKKSRLQKSIQRDLLLLENQLPIFVLQKLYKTFRKNTFDYHSNDDFVDYPYDDSDFVDHAYDEDFVRLARKYFADYDPETKETKIELKDLWLESLHFTDLIRYLHIPLDLSYERYSSKVVIKTATKLKQAGVSFEKISNKCLLDIKFKKSFLNWILCLSCLPGLNLVTARLQFPQLNFDDNTEYVLRNLMALEQCHYPHHHYLCNYVSLLGYLIHSKEDVDLLVDDEILVHHLGSHEQMATLVNGLSKQVVITSHCYGKIMDEMNEHYESSWKRFMGEIKWVYFRDLFRCSLTIVGVCTFLFTFFNFLRMWF